MSGVDIEDIAGGQDLSVVVRGEEVYKREGYVGYVVGNGKIWLTDTEGQASK